MVELLVANEKVAGSNLVSRSKFSRAAFGGSFVFVTSRIVKAMGLKSALLIGPCVLIFSAGYAQVGAQRVANTSIQQRAASIPVDAVRSVTLEFARTTYDRTRSSDPRTVKLTSKRAWLPIIQALKKSSRLSGVSEPAQGWGTPVDMIIVTLSTGKRFAFEIMGPPMGPRIRDAWGAEIETLYLRYRARAFPASGRR